MLRDELIKIKKADVSKDGSLVIHLANAVADFRRDKLRLSQRQFAGKVGISRRTLNNIEKGRSQKYSIHTIYKIISSLGVSLSELFDGMIYLQNPVIEGTLKGEYKTEYPEGLKIFSFFPQNKAFFFGLMEVEAKKSISQVKLPKADYVLFQGHRGKLVLPFQGKEYLLSEDKHLIFHTPGFPSEIYNPEVRIASCFLLTVPHFL